MLKRKIRPFAFGFLILSLGRTAYAQEAFTVDVPGATFTRVIGLNAQGDVCGGTQLNGVRLAFAASRQAGFTDLTTFAYPGSVFTQCRGINAVGQMVGVYQSADARSHAFVKDGSEFISIDVPGATDTRGFGIDPRGQIVGRYTSPDGVATDCFWSEARWRRTREDEKRDGVASRESAMGLLHDRRARATATEASGITPQGEITASTDTPTEGFTATSCQRTGSRRSTFPALCIRGPQPEVCG